MSFQCLLQKNVLEQIHYQELSAIAYYIRMFYLTEHKDSILHSDTFEPQLQRIMAQLRNILCSLKQHLHNLEPKLWFPYLQRTLPLPSTNPPAYFRRSFTRLQRSERDWIILDFSVKTMRKVYKRLHLKLKHLRPRTNIN